MTSDEDRIRELAYQIWESEGRPEGQTERHWAMARKLAESEDAGAFVPPPGTEAATRPKPTRKAPTKDETQVEKPALLGKPTARQKKAAADAVSTAPDKPQAATKARTPPNKTQNR
ncbi:DUF2934 domain-containing protein [Halopseudomonas sp.]|uniref:DUF2934 domain-containing protein n=1 Tax=Halopseudomonas sp. TaxID=2901191 RepID=UPI003566641E